MPQTLLLADDSVTIQRVIELTFADEDIHVVAVGDGDQAIERLKASPPDIVLADIGMPGKSGYEVAQYMRQRSDLAHIPVVLLTGAFEPVDEARAAEAGCDGVLAKPFEPQLVIGRVKDLLAKGRGSAGAAPDDTVASAAQPSSSAGPATPPAAAVPPAATETPLDEYFDRLDAAFSSLSAPPAAEPPAPELQPRAAEAPPPDAGDMRQWTSAPAVDSGDIDWFSAAPAPRAPAAERDVRPVSTDAAPDLSLSNTSSDAEFASAWEISPVAAENAASAAAQPALADAPSRPGHGAYSFESQALADQAAAAGSSPASAPATLPTASTAWGAAVETTPAVSAGAAAPDVAAIAAERAAAPAAAARAASASAAPAAAAPLPAIADAFAALLDAETHDRSSAAPAWPAAASPATPAISDAVIEEVVRRVLERMSDAVVRETTADLVSRIAEQLVRQEIEKIKAAVK